MPHQGHGPRADQTGLIHISDFRFPVNSHLRNAADPYKGVKRQQRCVMSCNDRKGPDRNKNRRPSGRRFVNEAGVRLLQVNLLARLIDLLQEQVQEFFAFFAIGRFDKVDHGRLRCVLEGFLVLL